MGILHIKKMLLPKINSHYQVVLVDCQGVEDCGYDSYNDLPPPPPPPPPPYFDGDDESKSNVLISRNLLILFCCLAAFVILFCVLIILRKYRLNRRRTNSPNLDQTHEEFINEDHGPELIHPIWLINTIGLHQSVIDSIAIFKYKKDEVLIEGTDCSVCLSEFQEDESLRLLPNCSHAFHIPCIDTWLRSHKNCPLCRGPVVVDTNNVDVRTLERNLNGLSSMEDNLVDNVELGSDQVREDGENIGALALPIEHGNVSDNLDRSSPVVVDTNNVDVITLERNSNGLSSMVDSLVDNVENNVELGSDQVREGGENIGALALPIEQGNVSDNLDRSSRYFSTRDFFVRVQSDMADHIVKMEGELQQRRRSISMDSSSASMIHFAAANISSIADEPYLTRADSSKVARKGKLSGSRIFGVMESCSFRRYSGNRPISMKRSSSTSGKWSKQSSSRSQDSILPFSDSIVTSKF